MAGGDVDYRFGPERERYLMGYDNAAANIERNHLVLAETYGSPLDYQSIVDRGHTNLEEIYQGPPAMVSTLQRNILGGGDGLQSTWLTSK